MTDTPPSHPGSIGFLGHAWEMTKHVGGTALKWGAIGAGVVGIPAALVTLVIAGGLSLFTGGAVIVPMLVTIGVSAAAVAAIPTFFSLFSASKAAAGVDEESKANYERLEARQRQQAAVRMQASNMQGGAGQQYGQPNVPYQGRSGREMGAG